MNFPDNLRYTKDHEWIRLEGNEAFIGITDFAQHELGDIVYVEIETIGQELNSGDVFGTVEAVKTVSDLYLPPDRQEPVDLPLPDAAAGPRAGQGTGPPGGHVPVAHHQRRRGAQLRARA